MSFVGWLITVGYLFVRKYGGPGRTSWPPASPCSVPANVPFIYVSVNIWRTMHPMTTVVPTLQPGMRGAFWFSALTLFMLYGLLLAARVHLERQRTALDQLYLAEED
jgi:heme exporter protein C